MLTRGTSCVLNNVNAGCRVWILAMMGFCQKYLSTVNWSTARARTYSHLEAKKRWFAGNAAGRFISNGCLLFLGLTIFQ